jgi:hypothetical protein
VREPFGWTFKESLRRPRSTSWSDRWDGESVAVHCCASSRPASAEQRTATRA